MCQRFSFYLFLLLLCPAMLRAQDIATKLADLKAKNNLEEWLYQRIDYNAADPQHRLPFLMTTAKDAWRQPKNNGEQLAWLTLLSNQGYYQLLDGDILGSISSYENAYTWFYRYRLTSFDISEYVLKPLANNYTRLGDYERAIYIQQKTIDRLNPATDVNNLASVYCNMAIACYNMGNHAAAKAAVARGSKLAQSKLVRLRLQNILADIFYEEGNYPQSATLLKANLTNTQPTDAETAYTLSGTCSTLGKIYIRQSQMTDARRQFTRGFQLLEDYYPGTRQREKAGLLAQLGKIERLENHPPQSLQLLDRALQLLRINTTGNKTLAANIYGENHLVDIFHEKALNYQLIKQDTAALQNLRYALLATDRMRREFADSKTRERLQHEAKGLAGEAIAIALQLYQQTSDNRYTALVLEIAEQTKARTLADELHQNTRQLLGNRPDTVLRHKLNLERGIVYNERLAMTEKNPGTYRQKITGLKFELALLNKQHHLQTDAPVLNAAQILAGLPDSLHVVEYFVGERAVYSISISHDNIEVNRIAETARLQSLVNGLVTKYYQRGPEPMQNEPELFYKLSYSVYATLFKNITLKKNERLCIVPDDMLGYLSFDGLITLPNYEPATSAWPFLIKQVTSTYAFSLNTLVQNKTTSAAGSGFAGLFITHQDSKPIIAVKKEAEAINKLVRGDYKYDDAVNSNTFFQAFDKAGALHISTHAYLSGENKEPTLDLSRNKLYLFELLARQHCPQLVVLGACRTGDGLLAKGEGIISLARGFSAIGTPSTIAGLWNVNDDAAAQITAGLYNGLIAGNRPGVALHKAKLNWLNSEQPSDALYLPYYWDSLILMGADEPVQLQAASSDWLWWGIVGLVIIGWIIISYLKKRRKA